MNDDNEDDDNVKEEEEDEEEDKEDEPKKKKFRISKPKTKSPSKAKVIVTAAAPVVVEDRTAALEAQVKQLNETINGNHHCIHSHQSLTNTFLRHPPLLCCVRSGEIDILVELF